MNQSGDAQLAATTDDPDVLRRLAAKHPELRPVVYENHACPVPLKEHLRELGETGSDAAMASHLRATAGERGSQTRTERKRSAPPKSQASAAKKPHGHGRFVIALVVVVAIVFWVWKSTADPLKPAPDDALSLAFVTVPSKNVECELAGESARCTIFERSYAKAGLEDCDTELFEIVVDSSGVELACGQEFPVSKGAEFTELKDGQTTVQGRYACTLEADAMTCWDQPSGRGFTLAATGYEVF